MRTVYASAASVAHAGLAEIAPPLPLNVLMRTIVTADRQPLPVERFIDARGRDVALDVCVHAFTQVFGAGQTDAHCGVSKWLSDSVHFFGSMM